MRRLATLLACLPLLLPATSRADEVGDALGEATRAYQAGDLATTRSSLQEALQFLAQRSASALAAALPGPLAGWKAEDAETSAAALGLLGGGNQATRRYENAEGKAVELQVTADLPMITQLAMVMNNAAMMAAMGKLIRIGSQRAVQTTDNDVQMLVDNRIMVVLSGDAPVEAKLAYARAIDLAKLAAVK